MAVYTHVGLDDLALFLRNYDIGIAVSFKGIAEGVENSNYYLETDKGRFILTLYEKRVNAADLPFFLGLMRHLNGAGVACPSPVPTKSGEALGALNGRPAVIITFLEGVSLDTPRAAHCRALGEGLARMHEAAASFSAERGNDLSVAGWRKLAAAGCARADELRSGLRADIEAELDWLSAAWPSDLPRGVIHADLFPDNVFFLGDRLSGFIDFYFACTDYFAYDFAICLNAWCMNVDGALDQARTQALWDGYETIRGFKPEEKAAMPTLARGAALRFLLTRLCDWFTPVEGALVSPKDPLEYDRKLAFHRQASGLAAYGLEMSE